MTTTRSPAAPLLDPDAEPALFIHPVVGDDWPSDGLGDPGRLAAELPEPTTLAAGTWIAVDGGPADRRGVLSRLLARGTTSTRVHVAVRCTALLARGFVNVCAADGIAYAQVPRRTDIT